ncbi:hypothetical protein C8J56DRAFT_1002096 [Mycena floridula]|nr:hypothetical protein C8J56DRAFT_1002096 [Mycena floridula]
MNLGANLTTEQKALYLRTLPAIRERCTQVFNKATAGQLNYFDYHPDKEVDVTEFCVGIIERDFGTNYSQIPSHGRWKHFDQGIERIDPLVTQWKSQSLSTSEICKRLVDLFVVSVLLDAGAGNDWAYSDKTSGQSFGRSEGLAVCSFVMYESGFFSSDPKQPYRVDASVLSSITVDSVAEQMQVSATNPIAGLEGRTSLLVNLGKALKESPDLFGKDGRPGNMLDYLESQSIQESGQSGRSVPLVALWHVLIDGFNPIWPASRVTLGGIALGDVWPCDALKATEEGDDLVPFHKLTQWMTYCLIQAFEKVMGWKFDGIEDLTGLPEYRNGGLLMDLGVLTLKPGLLPLSASGLPRIPATHPAIIEWRAMTVISLDRTANSIGKKLGVTAEQMSLAQVLEFTWKGGREIAKQKRPPIGGPPIDLESDGTVF